MIGSMTLTVLLADTKRMTTAMVSHDVSASEGFRKEVQLCLLLVKIRK